MNQFVEIERDNPKQFSKILEQLSALDRRYGAEDRLEYIVPKIIRKFPETIYSVGAHLVNPSYLVYRSGHQSVMGAKIVDRQHFVTRIERHGLSMSNLQEFVIPGLWEMYNETREAQSNTELALRKIGEAVGVAVANSQMMGDTNTRTARILQDYITHGTEGVTPERAFDDVRNYLPSREIEDSILEQNIVRLCDGIKTGGYVAPLGRAVYVSDSLRELLAIHQDTRDALEITNGYGSIDERLRAALAQRVYGAAALLVYMSNSSLELDINNVKQGGKRIVRINEQLLSMRVLSHISAFTSETVEPTLTEIRDSTSDNAERELVRIAWKPLVYTIDKS